MPALNLEYQVKARKDRRERGICGEHGCREVTGDDYRCFKHAAQHAAKMRRLRADRDHQSAG